MKIIYENCIFIIDIRSGWSQKVLIQNAFLNFYKILIEDKERLLSSFW